MKLSVIIVCYNMTEQVANTLRSLLPPYQTGIREDEIEILLLDNGSADRLPAAISSLSPSINYTYIAPAEALRSPGAALNAGARRAKAARLCLMIDGARILSPGVLAWGQRLLDLAPGTVVEVRGWHLSPLRSGPEVTTAELWKREQEALRNIAWLENGYRLFDIAVASAQTQGGFSGPTRESNCVFLSRDLFEEIAGFNEGYSSPGGGLLNIDFFARAAAKATNVFTLLGEGTFHQSHGGAATGQTKPDLAKFIQAWSRESDALQSPARTRQPPATILAGHIPSQSLRWLGSGSTLAH